MPLFVRNWFYLVCFLFLSCKKAGTGGDAKVSMHVKHHGVAIPGATVYVKYNEKEFPGTDVTKYDLLVVCGNSGHSAGHTHVKNLRKGYYYFYSVGFDSSILQAVSGGISLLIKHSERKKEVELTVPVTE